MGTIASSSARKRIEELDRRLEKVMLGEDSGDVGKGKTKAKGMSKEVVDKQKAKRKPTSIEVEKERGTEWGVVNFPSPSRKSRSKSRSRSASPMTKARKKKTTRSPQKSPAKDNKESEEALDRKLREIIRADEKLYQRILRYEVSIILCCLLCCVLIGYVCFFVQPIHLDTFMSIPDIKDMDGRGFQFQLRGFLDRHVCGPPFLVYLV